MSVRRLLLSIHIFDSKSLGLGPPTLEGSRLAANPVRIKAPYFAVNSWRTSAEFFCYSWQTDEGSGPQVEQGSPHEI